MNIDRIKRIPRERRRTVMITIRVTPEISRWLKLKNYSPTALFYEAIKELGFKEGGKADAA